MCLLKLKSTNPNFSFILFKNPESGMQVRSMRQGFAYGFYFGENNDSYIIYFRDGPNQMSYKEYRDQNYEYLNKLSYTSPIFVWNAISEFLNSTTNKQHEYDVDDKYIHKLVNSAVNISNQTMRAIERLNNFFPDFVIEMKQKESTIYKIKLQTNKSLYYLLNFATVYFGIISMLNDNDLFVDENLVSKLIKSMNIIDVDYYVRYIVSSRLLLSKKLYGKFIKEIEKPNMKLQYGTTAMQRRDHIRSLLQFDNNVIDIGCGDGFYAIPFAGTLQKSNKDLRYYAIDIDEEELFKLDRKATNKELTNIVSGNSHKVLSWHIQEDQVYDVIITEVIEHMGKEESQEIIRWVFQNVNYNKIIITTPNFDFNKYYNMGEKLRHDDHKWELTQEQFAEYMNEVMEGFDNLKTTYLGLGDHVDDIPCSQGILIQKID